MECTTSVDHLLEVKTDSYRQACTVSIIDKAIPMYKNEIPNTIDIILKLWTNDINNKNEDVYNKKYSFNYSFRVREKVK